MKLIANKLRLYHVSQDTVEEFEKTILLDKSVKKDIEFEKNTAKFYYYLWKIGLKIGIENVIFHLVKGRKKTKEKYLTILMGLDLLKCFPRFCMQGKKNIFLFDAWPKSHNLIIKFANSLKIDNIFLTSSQATEMLSVQLKETKCHWVPEGVEPRYYKAYPVEKKDIDLLALGRKYDLYHNQIADFCSTKKINYLYEKIKGQLIFPTRDEFIDGLARTKISVCVPSNITHPERAGEIETMTIRYLQSMASKSLILGTAPKEMIKLFGYNPVIEIDWENPKDQLLLILNNYKTYKPLIEKNYTNVLLHHSWEKRWQDIKEII